MLLRCKMNKRKNSSPSDQNVIIEEELPPKFFELLNKAILYSPKEGRTSESLNSDNYNDKQIHLHKSEDTSD